MFKTQSLFTISLATTYGSLGSATTTRILYTKPDGTDGYWTANVSGTSLTYNVTAGDIDQAGTWQFQAYVVVGGRIGYGDIADHNFEYPLQ